MPIAAKFSHSLCGFSIMNVWMCNFGLCLKLSISFYDVCFSHRLCIFTSINLLHVSLSEVYYWFVYKSLWVNCDGLCDIPNLQCLFFSFCSMRCLLCKRSGDMCSSFCWIFELRYQYVLFRVVLVVICNWFCVLSPSVCVIDCSCYVVNGFV